MRPGQNDIDEFEKISRAFSPAQNEMIMVIDQTTFPDQTLLVVSLFKCKKF